MSENWEREWANLRSRKKITKKIHAGKPDEKYQIKI
jgi:hypothetical protein